MPRLPTIKIHAKAADSLSANVVSGINQAKKLLRFRLSKERGVEEFCNPIHLMASACLFALSRFQVEKFKAARPSCTSRAITQDTGAIREYHDARTDLFGESNRVP